jgi:hypothetical protein
VRRRRGAGAQHVAEARSPGPGWGSRCRRRTCRGWGTDPHVRGLHRVGDVAGQPDDPLHLDARADLGLVAGHGRAAGQPGHLGVDIELLEHPGEGGDGVVVGAGAAHRRIARGEQRERRQLVVAGRSHPHRLRGRRGRRRLSWLPGQGRRGKRLRHRSGPPAQYAGLVGDHVGVDDVAGQRAGTHPRQQVPGRADPPRAAKPVAGVQGGPDQPAAERRRPHADPDQQQHRQPVPGAGHHEGQPDEEQRAHEPGRHGPYSLRSLASRRRRRTVDFDARKRSAA